MSAKQVTILPLTAIRNYMSAKPSKKREVKKKQFRFCGDEIWTTCKQELSAILSAVAECNTGADQQTSIQEVISDEMLST